MSRVSGPLTLAMRCLPRRAGEPCGDLAAALDWPGGRLLVMLDGLGHGPAAAAAAAQALALLQHAPQADLPALVVRLDAGLRRTRGVAAALLRLDDDGAFCFAGVGNITVLRWQGGRPQGLPSQPGVLGAGTSQAVPVVEGGLAPGEWVLMHTDGVVGPLSLGPVLPEWRRDPALLCERLLQRHRQPEDDAGALAAHWQPQPCATPAPLGAHP